MSKADFDDALFHEIIDLLRSLFASSVIVPFLNREDVLQIVDRPNTIKPVADHNIPAKKNLIGYPVSPLFVHLANFFTLIMKEGTCPIINTPSFPQLDEGDHPTQRILAVNLVKEELQGALTLWDFWNPKQKMQMFRGVFSRLRRRGLLDLFQIRRTFGSVELLPIPRHLLYEACDELNDPSSSLTVCGRAFTKHAVRDSTGWWGRVSGTEAKKNADGLEKVKQILDEALWINIHHLPGQVITLEARSSAGYGVRFDYDPVRFRGFLEPYTEEGWVNRFKH